MGKWRHRLADIDESTEQATCAACGPVRVVRRGGRWRCSHSLIERERLRRLRHRERFLAWKTVEGDLRRGVLHKEPCLFCDSPDVEAHHHDYAQPRAITWLCARHHRLVHGRGTGTGG